MKRTISTVVAVLMIVSLFACATTPKISLKPEVKQSMKRIAIVETPEPDRYFMYPSPSPGGAALYMFGALGGAIVGGIEAKRQETATVKFTEAIVPLDPKIAKNMLTGLENRLLEKGYDVLRVSPPPMTPDGKNYDISKIEGAFDAILVCKLTAGYREHSGKVAPKVSVSVSIFSESGTDTLFADSYLYCLNKFGQSVQIVPDPKYVVKTIDELYEDLSVAVEGLRMGVKKISERAVSDL
jgi:hypothetical protein